MTIKIVDKEKHRITVYIRTKSNSVGLWTVSKWGNKRYKIGGPGSYDIYDKDFNSQASAIKALRKEFL